MNKKLLLFMIFCLCACKIVQAQNGDPDTQMTNTAPANTPMSCNIEGKVIKLLKDQDEAAGSPCAKHPCRAKVKIISVPGCGSSVSLALNAGDTVEMRFAYTLDNTAKIFPRMPKKYPGLKKGARFTARAEQRLKMGSDGEFVIYDYKRK